MWQREGWHQRLGLPERDSGFRYTAQQVAGLPTFDLDELMAYYDAVRRETLAYLERMTQADLETCPQLERRPGYSVGRMFSHVIVEESQHLGQVAYLRGVQRGLNK